ncbi:MAG TPA: DNA mismatch repair protein MutS, partial [Tabrizicola sp.]|nr:DNA mismatch repair protein MutS [Tabrizicola sp.]
LEARRHNFLAAFSEVRDQAAIAWADISTGEFRGMPSSLTRLSPDLARIAPRELLLNEAREREISDALVEGTTITPLSRGSFDSTSAEKRLCETFGVASLDAFGSFDRAEVSAMGALLDYLHLTQRGRLPFLRPPVREALGGTMQIDAATRRNLELTQALSGGRDGSLLSAIDRTVTSGGARLLDRRLSAPSLDLGVIQRRQEALRYLVETTALRDRLREALRRVPDIGRALSRLALDRDGPRDMTAIRAGLEQASQIARLLTEAPPLLSNAAVALVGHDRLVSLLDRALVAEPPLLARDGGFIAHGYDPELDETRALRDEGRGVIARMQVEYVDKTGIQSLKVKHNNVLGYFIETTTIHEDRMRAMPELFIHRQTTAGQVRFTTLALSDLETRILNSANHALEIEKRHYSALKSAILDASAPIAQAARALAEIDLIAGFADLSADEGWCEPEIDDSRAFQISGGRHPVVERALRQQGAGPFVANDCGLTDSGTPAIWLLTGPNMAGKSTFLRQNALIALLAQAGSHVPAKSARIGMVSQLFSRVGASDDLARGRSTFMVEMVETAAILNQANDRALVILDEIGRGTATYDGLSIAWATLEHLHEANRCRALFATHYHEMTALAGKLPGVKNATVAVKEWEGEVIFLHEVREGAADRSYGVQVARLAGLPASVIERAKVVLDTLEKGDREGGKQATLIDDLPLFRALPVQAVKAAAKESAVEARLKAVHPDELSPIEALQLIYEIKGLL